MKITAAQFSTVVDALVQILPMTQPADAVLSRYFRENPRLGQQERAFVADTVFALLRRRELLPKVGSDQIGDEHRAHAAGQEQNQRPEGIKIHGHTSSCYIAGGKIGKAAASALRRINFAGTRRVRLVRRS